MKRTLPIAALVSLLALVPASEVLGGGGLGAAILAGQITGPAVSATIVIDPSATTTTNPFKGHTSIAVQKGTSTAGANFLHQQASAPPDSLHAWVLGCDGTKGAVVPDSNFNVNTLTAIRFDNQPLTNWMPSVVANAILYGTAADGGLGLSFDPNHPVAGITDINNPVCTKIDDHMTTDGMPRYILSFTAVIQFAAKTTP